MPALQTYILLIMFKDPNMRIGVITSVIASIIVIIFVQPLLSAAWTVVVAAANIISSSILDVVYEDAAKELPEMVPLMVLFFLLIFFAVSFVFRGRPLDKLDRICLGAFFVIGFLTFVGIWGKAEIAGSYRQRVAVLAPHVSEQDLKLMEAEWKTVRTRAAHQRLITKMESLATTNSIKLPPLRP
jgi:hypothetical protein